MKSAERGENLSLVFIYSGEYAERVIRNLVNDPSFCKSCGLICDHCEYNVYGYAQNIRAAVQLPDPSHLPALIENPTEYMPKKIPRADLCVASGYIKTCCWICHFISKNRA